MDKINFKNLPNTTTPVNATNLNQLQTNVENDIKQIDTLRANGTTLPNEADLNNYTTAGVYYSTNATTSATMTNTPVTNSGFKLIVEYLHSAARLKQTIVTNNAQTSAMYVRTNTGTWGEWKKIIIEDDLKTKATIFASEPMDYATKTYTLQPRHVYLILTGHCLSNTGTMATIFAHSEYGMINKILESSSVQYSLDKLALTVTSTANCNITILDVGTY